MRIATALKEEKREGMGGQGREGGGQGGEEERGMEQFSAKILLCTYTCQSFLVHGNYIALVKL